METIVEHDLLPQVSRVNLRLVDKLIMQKPNRSTISDDVRQALIASRKTISQSWSIELKKPQS
jgi:ribosomal protein L1